MTTTHSEEASTDPTTVKLTDDNGETTTLVYELCYGAWRVAADPFFKLLGSSTTGWIKESNIQRSWHTGFEPGKPPSQLRHAVLAYRLDDGATSSSSRELAPTAQLSLDVTQSFHALLRTGRLQWKARIALVSSFVPEAVAMLRDSAAQTEVEWVGALVDRGGGKLRATHLLIDMIVSRGKDGSTEYVELRRQMLLRLLREATLGDRRPFEDLLPGLGGDYPDALATPTDRASRVAARAREVEAESRIAGLMHAAAVLARPSDVQGDGSPSQTLQKSICALFDATLTAARLTLLRPLVTTGSWALSKAIGGFWWASRRLPFQAWRRYASHAQPPHSRSRPRRTPRPCLIL